MKRYQIFISSTYTDLKLEREAVLQSVLKLQHIPIGMEYFVSANEEQFNYIKGLLDETDYYIIIIGNRYGSLAADGVSYTEKEFDYAVNLGIPVIACIHSNPDSLPVNKSDTKRNAKQKLEKFRNKVMNHRMVSYFNWNNPAALSAEIVVALVNTIERYPRPGWERVASYENSDWLNPINNSKEVEFQTDENFPEKFTLLSEHENGETAHVERDFEKSPNVHLAFKRDTEDSNDYPYYERLYDVKKITLMNFAATTFMAGYDIATIYQSNEYLRQWFQSRLMNGEIEVEAVLTNPYSHAAIDAEKYKMFPDGDRIQKSKIIIQNLNKFYRFKEKNPHAKMRIYLTNIALPYGLMITEHNNRRNNHIKVDMYAPVPGDDRFRPSFYLLEDNLETRELYHFYKNNLMKVMQEYSIEYDNHPDIGWLLKKNIIHKAKISSNIRAHTKMAFLQCMKRKFPIEVDLLSLSDGIIAVGRQNEFREITGVNDVSQLSWKQLKSEVKRSGVIEENQIFTLSEFLEYIHGVIPVLLEIKSNDFCADSQENFLLVCIVVDEIRTYIRKYGLEYNTGKVAVHSSNPYILRMIRDMDCMIPIGQISFNFDRSEYKDVVDEVRKKMHHEQLYMEIVEPDFISYDVRDLPNQRIQNLCKQHNIPLLAWTIKNGDEQEIAEESSDNIIIEGSNSYL